MLIFSVLFAKIYSKKMKQAIRETYPLDSLNLPEQEISIHKALNEISQKIIGELTTAG